MLFTANVAIRQNKLNEQGYSHDVNGCLWLQLYIRGGGRGWENIEISAHWNVIIIAILLEVAAAEKLGSPKCTLTLNLA